jgi:hypothetical protein
VVHVREINSPELVKYLCKRKIRLDIAKGFGKEAEFILYDRKHKAIGFKNNSGG